MKWFCLTIACLGLLGFAAFRTLFSGQTVSWHQRLTVIVDTPAGEVRGSAVTEVTNVLTDGAWVVPQAQGVHTTIKGEATVVEVTPGHFLFALVSNAGVWAYEAFDLRHKGLPEVKAKLTSQPPDSPVPLNLNDVESLMHASGSPMLVTFTDITDPKTVQKVDPLDFAASFGPGVALKAITLEITHDPMTEGKVASILPWLFKIWPDRLNGERFGNVDPNVSLSGYLSSNDFSTEIKK